MEVSSSGSDVTPGNDVAVFGKFNGSDDDDRRADCKDDPGHAIMAPMDGGIYGCL